MGSIAILPKGERPPLFFMHIPKTSGSSINSILKVIYGEDNFVEHIEALNRRANKKHLDITKQVDCVSGHVYLGRWLRFAGAEQYALATILRDPWKRLVSHINWMDRFNQGVDREALLRLDPPAQRAIRILAVTDFEDRRSIVRMRNRISKQPRWSLFDNLQTRMFSKNSIHEVLTQQSVERAIDAMGQFVAIGICDDQAAFSARISDFAKVKTALENVHANAAPTSARLSTSNDVARAALEQWMQFDAVLYERTLNLAHGAEVSYGYRGGADRAAIAVGASN
jgi:hypothetical protein